MPESQTMQTTSTASFTVGDAIERDDVELQEAPDMMMDGSGASLRVLAMLPPILGIAARRWLALDSADHTNHIVYEFETRDALSLHAELSGRSTIRCPHVLPIERVWMDAELGRVWCSSPYMGNQSGIVALGDLLVAKGGRFDSLPEARRAVEQVLVGLKSLHEAGVAFGSLRRDRLQIDPRGAVKLELHGFPSSGVRSAGMQRELAQDELAACGALAYELLTGQTATEYRAPVAAMLPRFGDLWDAWIERAMDPVGGFADAADAIASLPDPARENPIPAVSAAEAARLVIGGIGDLGGGLATPFQGAATRLARTLATRVGWRSGVGTDIRGSGTAEQNPRSGGVDGPGAR
ncbi:MAG: hypothetical protein AAF235_05890 [Planctomycetota bacterium]